MTVETILWWVLAAEVLYAVVWASVLVGLWRRRPMDDECRGKTRAECDAERNGPKHRTPIPCEKHEPRQHRDGRPPWCRACGLTADGRVPPDPLGESRVKSGRPR